MELLLLAVVHQQLSVQAEGLAVELLPLAVKGGQLAVTDAVWLIAFIATSEGMDFEM